MKKLYIGNCEYSVDDNSLQEFVESQGLQVSSAKIITDRATGRSRGFGFVELDESTDLNDAIETLNGKELNGRPLNVSEARESKPRQRSGGGGYGGNRY